MSNFQLTPAETGVLDLLLQGKSNRAIAETLVLSIRTVESHISSCLGKTGCRSRLQLSLWWMHRSDRGHGYAPVEFPHCRLSSVVEQRFCKAKVVGSNPSAGF